MNSSSRSPPPLRFIIVGLEGIGGLAAALALSKAGHYVTVLEGAPKILEIGAGIQVAPNMLRILDSWDIGKEARQVGMKVEQVQVLRWQDGAKLSVTTVDHGHGEQIVVHRGELHTSLLRAAKQSPHVVIRENSLVVDANLDHASVRLHTGELVTGDVLIGADGIKSMIRGKLLGDSADVAIPTGDSVFRLQLPREVMESDPTLIQYLDGNVVRRWIGPDRHVVAYPVRNKRTYNIAMAHPDRGGLDESWTRPGSREDMLQEFQGWHTDLVRMLELVPDEEILAWKLCSHPPLKTWVSQRSALIGDACHPMLPYVAQGAAQAVEDAAALGIIFSKVTTKKQITKALEIYERVRKERAETVQSYGTANRKVLHLHDGAEQVTRDHLFAIGAAPDRWVDKETRRFLWDWDLVAATEQACDGMAPIHITEYAS
ncbi:putative salicylate hydroxylase [Dactylonectria estremocensis]|uniref:Salicylate hydroxylase n=1 Tax=Dactylonectria estremocensis TaxID=1079267 RepID=A0A9P9J5A8_9HYPO|nr:putative salicylate hydroxylase [Dactylonectria estremocensis]